MFCGLSIAAPLVLPPHKTLGLFTTWLCCRTPLLLWSPLVHGDAGWLLRVFSMGAPGLLLSLRPSFRRWDWISGSPASPPAVCTEPPDASSHLDGRCCSLQCRQRYWQVCSCSLRPDWQALHLYFVLFVFIYVCSTLLSVLGYPERRYLN